MKRIYFIRHGKSSWKENIEDFDRPLAPRGEKAAELIGEYLSKHYSNRVIAAFSSAANRAKSTLQIVAKHFSFSSIELQEELYTFNNMTLQYQIAHLENDLEEVALFGHNPAFEMLVSQFTGKRFEKFPTCALAVVEFEEVDWKLCQKGTLIDYVVPKELG
ncbi:phosphohistidine phosphatase, SixA [Flavobacteriaceae bacterium UJ101]|nr:phosphohistidine phosphatase, SixA [Flavobacteriaceae bacterium UJ101]